MVWTFRSDVYFVQKYVTLIKKKKSSMPQLIMKISFHFVQFFYANKNYLDRN